MMSDICTPEEAGQPSETPTARKSWVPARVIVSEARSTEAHVTRFTDGTDTGGNHSQYGS